MTVTEDMCEWIMEKHLNFPGISLVWVALFLKYVISVNPDIFIYSDEDILQLICTMLVTEYIICSLARTIFSFLFSCHGLRIV